jgi:hypothetical protein
MYREKLIDITPIIINPGIINILEGSRDKRAKAIPFFCKLFTRKERVKPNTNPLIPMTIKIRGMQINVAPRIHIIKAI